jgi:hypothetical protein
MSKLVLWGHHVQDYKEMFDLNDTDLSSKILEYGCGPTAVNSELTSSKQSCISCDPLFSLDKGTFQIKTELIFAEMLDVILTHPERFNFADYGGLDGLLVNRAKGMEQFFEDYLKGRKEGRYIAIQEITLPFEDFTFDLALSSHYFFADLDRQDQDFHLAAIKELARVAKEVRIFPLADSNQESPPFLGPILLALQQENYGAEIKAVPYHLQKQGNALLRVWARECTIPHV